MENDLGNVAGRPSKSCWYIAAIEFPTREHQNSGKGLKRLASTIENGRRIIENQRRKHFKIRVTDRYFGDNHRKIRKWITLIKK